MTIKRGCCSRCGHKTSEHEIAAHTPQRGICLADWCKCMSLESPSDNALWNEIERLQKLEKVAKEVYPLREFCFGPNAADEDGPQKLFRAIKRFSPLFADRYSADTEEQEATLPDVYDPESQK
jgi:hypothetical protein